MLPNCTRFMDPTLPCPGCTHRCTPTATYYRLAPEPSPGWLARLWMWVWHGNA